VYKGVTTSELDELAAETAASLTATYPDYAILAARIAVSNLHKSTLKSFSATMKLLYEHKNPRTGMFSANDRLGCTDKGGEASPASLEACVLHLSFVGICPVHSCVYVSARNVTINSMLG
jgi:hypothetical protein